MITPSFSCTQTNTAVIASIYVPAVRASDVDIHAEGTLLSVHIAPYFLRLTLPGRIIEDDASSARYDPGSGFLIVTLTKEVAGQDFKDLDILAKLLAPKRDDPPHAPIIEVVASEDVNNQNDAAETELINATDKLSLDLQDALEASENDWQLPQQVPDPPSLHTSNARFYGFLNMHTGYFRYVASTENEVNELGPDAEMLSEKDRRIKRLAHEDEKWDEEHYMADYADDEWIQQLITYEFPTAAPGSSSGDESFEFTEEENMMMLRLPQKEYLCTPRQTRDLYLTLLTILFAYAYDVRTTQHDPTPESAWTISTLIPAFSALDPPPYHITGNSGPLASAALPLKFTPSALHDTLLPPLRRTLAFPLYRSVALSTKCIADVGAIMGAGKRTVLRALLATKRVLDAHEVYYVYSKVWIDDFCGWVARDAKDDVLVDIGRMLADLRIDKTQVGWDLLALEAAVHAQMNMESDSDDESFDGSE